MNHKLLAVLLLAACAASSFGQATAFNRVVAPIDDSKLTQLSGNTLPITRYAQDLGPAAVSEPTGKLVLLLQRSAAQQASLDSLVSNLNNPSSAQYHKWLTPKQYGTQYGISDQDLQSVEGWLAIQGFSEISVSPARNAVFFSGSVGQVNQAFHTEIHRYSVNGQVHLANNADPSIPTALTPVVRGVAALHDFTPKSMVVRSAHRTDTVDAPDKFHSMFTQGSPTGIQYFTPAAGDAAVMYDTPNAAMNPAYHGTTYDGTGVTIGIAGDSDLSSSALQDIANYRATFLNDPTGSHAPTIVVDGNTPTVNSDELEALTDVEQAEALAPGANVTFYTAASTDLQQGLMLAMMRAVNDNTVSILNVSFGTCEQTLGAAGNATIAEMWEQAAAQGISVTVASGDSGSAACDQGEADATQGLAVNGLASTPYDIAVGGTDFPALFGTSNISQYITPAATANFAGTAPYYTTALGYIPEEPWNDSSDVFTTYSNNEVYEWGDALTSTTAAGGGPSSAAYCASGLSATGTCSTQLQGYPKPAYQASLTGSDGVRDLPDVSLFSGTIYNDGGNSPDFTASWSICSDSTVNGDSYTYTDCQLSNGQITTDTSTTNVGGTSTAAPALAGILALVSEAQGGARLGQADFALYNLADSQPAIFHDVTTGNNSVYCASNSTDCGSNNFTTGFNAGAGYDMASGLGSIDVAKLVSAWSSVSFQPTTTAFTLGTTSDSLGTGAITITHGTPLFFNAAVDPTSATGTVAFVNNSQAANAGSTGNATLVNGVASGSNLYLPGGTYTAFANYGGDTVHAGSESNGIPVTVNAEGSQLSFVANVYSGVTPYGQISATTVQYGQNVYLDATPYGSEGLGKGTPATGTVTLTQNGTSLGPVTLNSTGSASYTVNSSTLSPGKYTWTANYSGDSSYNPSTASTSLTVTQAPVQVSIVSPTGVESMPAGTEGSVEVSVITSTGGAYPTGTVTLYKNGTSFSTLPVQSYATAPDGQESFVAFPITQADIAPGTSATFYAVYSGDTNYQGGEQTGSVEFVVSGSGIALLTNGSSTTIATPGQSGSGTVSLSGFGGFTGAVALSCTVSGGPANAVDQPTCSVPSTVTISGTTAVPVNVMFNTTAATTAALNKQLVRAIGGAILACALFAGFPARRRKVFTPFLMIVILVFSITGCGNSSSAGSSTSTGTSTTGTGTSTGTSTGTGTGTGSGTTTNPGTTPGTYTVTVTAAATGVTTATATTSFVVQ